MQQEINVPALFAAHSECKTIFNKANGLTYHKILNIDFYKKQVNLYRDADRSGWWPLESCLLGLKPLSTITDDHLEMIARMAFENGKLKADRLERIDRSNTTGVKVYFEGFKAHFVLGFSNCSMFFNININSNSDRYDALNDPYAIDKMGTMVVPPTESRDYSKKTIHSAPFSVLNSLEICDTLRLLDYDMGYMHIPSLIEDGRYAIDITKLQKP